MNGLIVFFTTSCLALVVLLIIAGLLRRCILIAKEYERLVVFRLGRSIGAKGPGLVFLFPFIDTATKVDLREQFISRPRSPRTTPRS